MTLKDQIQKDNTAVFINDEDFAEEHDLNGTVCKAILQNLNLSSPLTDPTDIIANGFIGNHLIVHYKQDDLPETPTYDMAFTVDGTLYLVEAVSEDMGIVTLTLALSGR